MGVGLCLFSGLTPCLWPSGVLVSPVGHSPPSPLHARACTHTSVHIHTLFWLVFSHGKRREWSQGKLKLQAGREEPEASPGVGKELPSPWGWRRV